MKKLPTLFERIYENHRVAVITEKVTTGMEWVLAGGGIATVKVDGSCCSIINETFYKRYDCKKGKLPPDGFIPCCEPDSITGHWPGWIECDRENPSDKWFWNAYDNTPQISAENKTYEAIGPHFQGNPYGLSEDMLEPHGMKMVEIERTFSGIRKYLEENDIEGMVFWKDGTPQCKVKRSDFGFRWNEHH